MTTMYMLATSSRELEVAVAEVTKCDLGLIARPQVELGSLRDLVATATRERPLSLKYPALIMGDGYQARSSAGFVKIDSWSAIWEIQMVIAGEYRRTGDIRPHRPVRGGILSPCTVWADTNPGWGIEAAASILYQLYPGEVIISEGQSNWSRGYHLCLGDNPLDVDIRRETRSEVLEPLRLENFTAALLRAAFRANKGLSGPLLMARESVRQSAEQIHSQELDEFLTARLGQGTQASAWEASALG